MRQDAIHHYDKMLTGSQDVPGQSNHETLSLNHSSV